jgi:hypothetical protein
MSLGVCRACGRQIKFIKTPAGKHMPCDPEAVAYWQNDKAKGKIVRADGIVVSCEFEGEMGTETGVGWKSHFGTCPKADRVRRLSRVQAKKKKS